MAFVLSNINNMAFLSNINNLAFVLSNINNMAVKIDNSWLGKERLRETSHAMVTSVNSKKHYGVSNGVTRQGNSDKKNCVLIINHIIRGRTVTV